MEYELTAWPVSNYVSGIGFGRVEFNCLDFVYCLDAAEYMPAGSCVKSRSGYWTMQTIIERG